MSLSTLPPEVLEQIFKSMIAGDYLNRFWINKYLKPLVLVCRKWASILNPMIWKELLIRSTIYDKNKAFSFYKHVMNPEYSVGQHIKTLRLYKVPYWPICIAKMLKKCSNIVNLELSGYWHKGAKGKYNGNLLENILQALPNLRRLDLIESHEYFGEKNIQHLIDTRKDLQIKATRKCPQLHKIGQWIDNDTVSIFSNSEMYENKEWHCSECKTGKYAK